MTRYVFIAVDFHHLLLAGLPAHPTRLLRPLDVTTSVLASIPRMRAGAQARPSKAPR